MTSQNEKQEQEGQLTVPTVNRLNEAMAEWGMAKLSSGFITSLPGATQADKEAAFDAKNGNHPKLDDYINANISIVNWLVSPVDFTDENTGEMVRKPLLRLMLSDGSIVQTTSETVARQVFDYNKEVRPAPWHPPWIRTVKRRDGKPPNKYFTLEPVKQAES